MAVPVALFVYLSLQARYFGRWLLPAYPALAMLAAVALVRAAEALPARRGRVPLRAVALPALVALVLAQPAGGGRAQRPGARPRGHPDPGARLARGALPARAARGDRAGGARPLLPLEPGRHAARAGSPAARPRDGWTAPGFAYAGPGGRRVCARFKPGQFARPDGGVRASAYHMVLSPSVIDDYRRYGYCLVMTLDVVRERALETGDPDVAAYYRRLERDGRLVREFSPYDPGANPVPFSFDLSYNYYPTAYRRPGPTVRLYRLRRLQAGIRRRP